MKKLDREWLFNNSVSVDKILHPVSLFLTDSYDSVSEVNDSILEYEADQPHITDETRTFLKSCQLVANSTYQFCKEEGHSRHETDSYIMDELSTLSYKKGMDGYFVIASRAKHTPHLTKEGEYVGTCSVHTGWRIIHPMYVQSIEEVPALLEQWVDKQEASDLKKAKEEWSKNNA